jgi:hypothetical protein
MGEEAMSKAGDLNELLSRWVQARAQGRVLSAEELCAEQPDLLVPLQRRIAEMQKLEPLTRPALVLATETTPASLVDNSAALEKTLAGVPLPLSAPSKESRHNKLSKSSIAVSLGIVP